MHAPNDTNSTMRLVAGFGSAILYSIAQYVENLRYRGTLAGSSAGVSSTTVAFRANRNDYKKAGNSWASLLRLSNVNKPTPFDKLRAGRGRPTNQKRLPVSEFPFKSSFAFAAGEGFPIDHIGIAVEDLDQAIAFYQKTFGCTVDAREVIAEQKVELAFLRTPNSLIELLTPTAEDSTLAKFLKTRGPGLHHLCYLVPDIRKELRRLERLGFQLIDKTPRGGAYNSLIAFIHPKSTVGVLTELCERRHA